MEPTQLQLVLNVVTITGVTSLAGYCYLLKKENRKLATSKADSRADSESHAPQAEAKQPVARPVVHLQVPAPHAQPVKTENVDIRTFASARRNRWVKGLASSIS
ncbi:MAG: hypothetical protein ACRD4E_12925 [Bryobacteraceae bacterium]